MHQFIKFKCVYCYFSTKCQDYCDLYSVWDNQYLKLINSWTGLTSEYVCVNILFFRSQ